MPAATLTAGTYPIGGTSRCGRVADRRPRHARRPGAERGATPPRRSGSFATGAPRRVERPRDGVERGLLLRVAHLEGQAPSAGLPLDVEERTALPLGGDEVADQLAIDVLVELDGQASRRACDVRCTLPGFAVALQLHVCAALIERARRGHRKRVCHRSTYID